MSEIVGVVDMPESNSENIEETVYTVVALQRPLPHVPPRHG
jgi:hypothetical protein